MVSLLKCVFPASFIHTHNTFEVWERANDEMKRKTLFIYSIEILLFQLKCNLLRVKLMASKDICESSLKSKTSSKVAQRRRKNPSWEKVNCKSVVNQLFLPSVFNHKLFTRTGLFAQRKMMTWITFRNGSHWPFFVSKSFYFFSTFLLEFFFSSFSNDFRWCSNGFHNE